jgi:hypothetical protein
MSTLTLNNSSLESLRSQWPESTNKISSSSDLLSGTSSKDNKVDFANALSILSDASSSAGSQFFSLSEKQDPFAKSVNPISSIDGDYSQSALVSDGDEEEVTESKVQTLSDKFSILDDNPTKSDWSALESQTANDDYSILDKLGDGLMTAAKFAANMYIGKVI